MNFTSFRATKKLEELVVDECTNFKHVSYHVRAMIDHYDRLV